MKKKNFVNPTATLIKLETSAMICGSGGNSINSKVGNGLGVGGSTPGSTPTPTTQGGVTGIFGDAKVIGGFRLDN